jgi:hypothetical protein
MARKINNELWRTREQLVKLALTCIFIAGAGDENRTRTISLGICTVRACHMA